APQPSRAQAIAGQVARDREDPGAQRRALPPALPVPVQSQERLHHQVLGRRRVVQDARQVATEGQLVAAAHGLQRRGISPPVGRKERLVARLRRDWHSSRLLYPGSREEVQLTAVEPGACLAGTREREQGRRLVMIPLDYLLGPLGAPVARAIAWLAAF